MRHVQSTEYGITRICVVMQFVTTYQDTHITYTGMEEESDNSYWQFFVAIGEASLSAVVSISIVHRRWFPVWVWAVFAIAFAFNVVAGMKLVGDLAEGRKKHTDVVFTIITTLNAVLGYASAVAFARWNWLNAY